MRLLSRLGLIFGAGIAAIIVNSILAATLGSRGFTENIEWANAGPTTAPATGLVEGTEAIAAANPRIAASPAATARSTGGARPERSLSPTPRRSSPDAPSVAPAAPLASPTTAAKVAQHSALIFRERVSKAKRELRTGQLEAVIDYPNGSRWIANIRFDLGSTDHEPRFAITTTYAGRENPQTIERITIGKRSWQRQPDGNWTTLPVQIDVVEQLESFLPNLSPASTPQIVGNTDQLMLRWYDSNNDTEVTLAADTTSGIPQTMQQVTRATGAKLTVTYIGWNTPVDIAAPQQ